MAETEGNKNQQNQNESKKKFEYFRLFESRS